jgi:transcriptional regulator with XRE-family HTH domain
MADKLYAIRRYHGATQEEVAYLSGMYLSTYQSMEKGEGDNTDVNTLGPITEVLGWTVDQLQHIGPLPERPKRDDKNDADYVQKIRKLLPAPMSPENFAAARRLLERHRGEVKELHVELARQKKQKARKGGSDEPTRSDVRGKGKEID